jgi:hypothetical protein
MQAQAAQAQAGGRGPRGYIWQPMAPMGGMAYHHHQQPNDQPHPVHGAAAPQEVNFSSQPNLRWGKRRALIVCNRQTMYHTLVLIGVQDWDQLFPASSTRL